MTFDQAQSPRLGQPTSVESTYVRMFTGAEIPEAAWPGQIIYRTDTQILQVFSELGGWQDVVGGELNILTYVGPSIPVAHLVGDIWFDSDDGHKMYVAANTGASTIGPTAWVLMQDSASAAAAAAAAQSTANAAVVAVNALDTITTPDGLAPSSSPTPTVIGGTGGLFVRWTAVSNHDPVTYEVHCDTSGPTFTCNSGTKQVETAATSYSINESLANGTVLLKDGTVTYYVRIIAKDVDGSAAAGTAGSGSPRQITGPDVSADYVYTNYLNALQITGSELDADLAIVGKVKTALDGQRVEISSQGLKQFGPDGITVRVDLPNDPTKNPFLDGVLTASGLTVKNGMELRGTDNIFAMGSKIIMQTQTVASAIAPSMTIDYPLAGISFGQWVNPICGFWSNTSETATRFCTNFFGTIIQYHNAGHYIRPIVTRADGSLPPDYTMLTATTITVTGGAERMVTLSSQAQTGAGSAYYTDKAMFTTWDDSGLLADGSVAPIKKAELQDTIHPVWYYYREPHLGRAFSSSGSARSNTFCFYDRDTAYDWGSRPVYLKVFSATDVAITQITSRTLASDGFLTKDEGVRGITFGSSARMGFTGTDEDIWVIHGTVNNYVYKDGVTLTRQTFREFTAMPSVRRVMASGDVAANDFSAFVVAPVSDGTEIYKHTNLVWGSTDSPVWWGSFTWYDSVGTTHETPQSARSQLTMLMRARLNVTVPDLPDPATGKGTTRAADDVNSFQFYLGRGASDPGRTSMQRQTSPTALTTQISYTSVNFTVVTSPPLTTTFPDQAPSSIESNALGTGSFPKIQLTGDGNAHFEALDVGGAGASSFTGRAFDQLYYSIRAQSQMFGGGVKTVDASYNISWSNRFISISLGQGSNITTDGFFDITMPANGTVIPGYGTSSHTVSSGTINLAAWEALYYELPYGVSHTSLAANFRVVLYGTNYTVPNNWILIAMRNGDSAQIEWVTGETVQPGYDSTIYNIGGQRIKKFNFANASGTVSGGGGVAAYAHGLGQTPSQVLVSKGGGASTVNVGLVGTLNSTTFSVTFISLSGGAYIVSPNGTVVPLFFVAIAE